MALTSSDTFLWPFLLSEITLKQYPYPLFYFLSKLLIFHRDDPVEMATRWHNLFYQGEIDQSETSNSEPEN